jgi:hypothetical protein
MSTVDVIREGEESIRGYNSISQLVHPFLAFFSSQKLRNSVEGGLPSLTFDTLYIKVSVMLLE